MTLEEAISLANAGDVEAMRNLGFYYFKDETGKIRDMYESLKYFEMGAEKGDIGCIKLSIILLLMSARAIRHVAGASGIDSVLRDLDKAWHWNQCISSDVTDYEKNRISILGEKGIAIYFKGTDSDDVNLIRQSVDMLKGVMNDSIDPEVRLYLAFGINDLHHYKAYVSTSEYTLQFNLLTYCINECPNLERTNIACAYLAGLYTFGLGTSVNYDMAVYYYQMATQKGFDCSDMLSHFKKNIFGKWQLK